MRLVYRTRQFWRALHAKPGKEELALIQQALSPPLLVLFLRMQASEQAHSFRVFHRLLQQGEKHPDLLAAALLHDVGKSLHPLRLWERVMIVLGKHFFPEQANLWGQGGPSGLQRAFVVSNQHPRWGAEMAKQAGASPVTVRLIERHQDPAPPKPANLEDQLLFQLQLSDNES